MQDQDNGKCELDYFLQKYQKLLKNKWGEP